MHVFLAYGLTVTCFSHVSHAIFPCLVLFYYFPAFDLLLCFALLFTTPGPEFSSFSCTNTSPPWPAPSPRGTDLLPRNLDEVIHEFPQPELRRLQSNVLTETKKALVCQMTKCNIQGREGSLHWSSVTHTPPPPTSEAQEKGLPRKRPPQA